MAIFASEKRAFLQLIILRKRNIKIPEFALVARFLCNAAQLLGLVLAVRANNIAVA